MTLPASGAISFSNIDTELGYSATAQIGLNCSAVRTLFGQASGAICMNTGHGKSNTSVPGAPTGVSASATSCSAISVSFSAPSCTGHLSIDYYQVVCTSSGSNSATGSSSPISVTGLSASTSYTFKVRAHNSKGYGCYSSSTGTATTQQASGSQSYTTSGSYTWVVPSGVTGVSVLAIGGGGNAGNAGRNYCICCNFTGASGGYGGGGGGTAWACFTVSPGGSKAVSVGGSGGLSYFCSGSVFEVGGGTSRSSGGVAGSKITCGTNGFYGAWGGSPGLSSSGGNNPALYGTGAGGGGVSYGSNPYYYCGCRTCTGTGASYCHHSGVGNTGPNGGSGGGGAGATTVNTSSGGGGGGGIGIYGRGSSGSGGSVGNGGSGGSGGSSGSSNSGSNGGAGGSYGGGGGGGGVPHSGGTSCTFSNGGSGASGAIRIIWPNSTRQFPNTNTSSP